MIKRDPAQLRALNIVLHPMKHAHGSVLIRLGDTHVLCTATWVPGVPKFLKGQEQGWLTAEYGMLPAATHTRTQREATQGKQSGRTQEIQRLIGRSLRLCVDLKKMPDYTLAIDCDVLQADGGTRTASITGASLAVYQAAHYAHQQGWVSQNPWVRHIAGISVGLVQGTPYLDLDYALDSQADTDLNVVMTEELELIEIQGTAEKQPLSHTMLDTLLELSRSGIADIFQQLRAFR